MVNRAWIVFACLVSGWAMIARAQRTEPVAIRRPFATFPARLGEWTTVEQQTLEPDVLRVLGVDDYLTRIYADQAHAGVGLYVGFWATQQQGDTIHSPLNCLPGAGWEPLSKSFTRVAVAGSHDLNVNRYLIQKGLDKQLVVYWYQSHGRVVASEYWSKFYLVADSVRLHKTDAAIVRIIAPVLSDDPAGEHHAEQLAVRFAQVLYPTLSTYLPQ